MLKQSTARSLVVFMTDSTDHVTGKTGLTLTTTASKDGAAFGSISPTVTELANGWYKLALTTSHTDTLGYLALHITASGADPTDMREEVVVDLPGVAQTGDNFARLGAPAGASVSADVAAVKAVLPAALVGGRMDSSVGAMAANTLTATAIAADAITAAKIADAAIDAATFAAGAINAAAIAADAITAAKVADGTIDAATFAAGAINAAAIAADAITDAKVAADVTIASVTGAVGSVTGNVGGNVVGSVASVAARVTANTDQLAGQTVSAAAGVTFPTSVASPTNITAGVITTVTNLTNAPTSGDLTAAMKASVNAEADTALSDAGVNVTVTGRIDAAITTRLAAASYTAPDNTSIAAIKTRTDNLPSDPADASDIAAATTAIANFLTALGLELDTVKDVTDKLNDMLEADSSPANYRLTAHALANAPTGGSAPSAATIADAVWDEAIAGHVAAGSTGLALSNASSAGNPWATVITGAFTAEDILRVLVAVAAGRSSVTAQGGGAAAVEFHDVGDDSVIVQAAMQNSNRSAMTLTP